MKRLLVLPVVCLLYVFFPRPVGLAEDTPFLAIRSVDTGFAAELLAFTPEQATELTVYPSHISGQAKLEVFRADKTSLLNSLVYTLAKNEYAQPVLVNPQTKTSDLGAKVLEQAVTLADTKETRVSIPLTEDGLFFVKLSAGSTETSAFVLRSAIGSVVKEGKTDFIFWSQHLTTQKSVGEGSVTLLNLETEVSTIAQGVINADGLTLMPLNKKADIALVESAGSMAIVPINYSFSSYHGSTFAPRKIQHSYFVFTDRPLYKPGDKVNFKAILRDDDDARYQIPSGTVTVEVYSGWGEKREYLYQKDHTISSRGTVDGELILPPTANGYYSIGLKWPGQAEVNYWDDDYFASPTVEFQVETYRKPEYFLTLTSPETELVRGDELTVNVSGEYFSGQPLAGVEVDYTLHAHGYSWEDYYFSEQDAKRYYRTWGGEVISEGKLALDDQGKAKLTLPSNQNDSQGKFQTFSLEVAYTDPSGNPTLAGKNFLVKSGEFALYQQSNLWRAFAVGDEIAIPLEVRSNTGTGSLVQDLKVKLERQWWEKIVDPKSKYPNWQEHTENLPGFTVRSDSSGRVELKRLAEKEGNYHFTVEGHDKRDNPIVKTVTVHVSRESMTQDRGADTPNLKLTVNKEKYLPGQQAVVNVTSFAKHGDLLLTFDRAYTYKYQVLSLDGASQTLTLNLEDQDMPNTFLTVQGFSPKSFDIASTKVVVVPEAKNLVVKLNTDKQTYYPGDTVKLTIITTDLTGKPVAANLGVWAVDKAIFELADKNYGDVFTHFWKERWESTKETHSLAGLVRYPTAEKGGGGGGPARNHFADTAYWNPSVQTDNGGTANLTFSLPDNLTTWMISALGASEDTKAGEWFTEIQVAKDIALRPILPNILRVGDKLELATLVHNFTSNREPVQVAFSSKTFNVLASDPDKGLASLDLVPASFQELAWPIVVPAVAKADYRFSADPGNKQLKPDSVSGFIPVWEPGYWDVDGEFLIGSGEKTVVLPPKLDYQQSSLELAIATSLAGTLPSSMKYLLNYPYGCTEQLTSALVPLLTVKKYPALYQEAVEGKNIDQMITTGLAKLVSKQNRDGGWGWWESESVPFITAYVLEQLMEAQKLGYPVAKTNLDSAVGYLAKDYDSKDPQAKVIAVWGQSQVSLEGLTEKINELLQDPNIYSSHTLAYLILAASAHNLPVDRSVDTLIGQAIASGESLSWVGSSTYDYYSGYDSSTALAARALMASKSHPKEVAQALRFLTGNRKKNYWSHSFATAQVIKTISLHTDAGLQTNSSYTVFINDAKYYQGTGAKTFTLPLASYTDKLKLTVVTDPGTNLFTTLSQRFFVTDTQAPSVTKGVSLVREYENQKGAEYNIVPGDLVRVKLTVDLASVPSGGEYTTYGLIEDHLPAGLVPVNTHLKNESDKEADSYHCYCTYEYLPDGVRIPLYHVYLGKRTYDYLARAVSVGTFLAPPASVELMYQPEIFGRTDFSQVTVAKEVVKSWLPAKVGESSPVKETPNWPYLLLVVCGILGVIVLRRRQKHSQEPVLTKPYDS